MIWLVAAAVVLVVPAVAFPLTDSPGFCRSCHEMRPYYAAWHSGPHARVSCVQCHVGPGIGARVANKFAALREVRDHFLGHETFPSGGVVVPDSRCARCHRKLPRTATGFVHASHPAGVQCARCHPTAGHQVSYAALAAEGVLARGLEPSGSAPATVPADARGRRGTHRRVSCTTCHDATTGCSRCHTAPKKHFAGDCDTCHRNPASFRFTHPKSTGCSACHRAPAGHFTGRCSQCHSPEQPFRSANFAHPPTGEHSYRAFACARCHPRGLTTVSCTCHGGGIPSGD